jgi:hypothetical protein
MPAPPVPMQPTSRALQAGPGYGGGPVANNFAPPMAGFSTTPSPPPGAVRPQPGPPTSPWAIVLINRADLPVIIEQRLFR